MKLPQLLSQYLYQTRKLDLPGIGSFTLDSEAVIPQETDKIGQMPATGIQFRNTTIAVADDALVNFVKEHTGKMKSLAASDLDFFLTTGRQLLNIGKPFYLEGIGTLVKNKDGRLDFTPGEYMVARIDAPGNQGYQGTERNVTDEGPRERESRSSSDRQALLLIAIVAGLLIIGGGGYYLYKRNSLPEPAAEKQAVVIPDTAARTDTQAAANPPSDTTAASKTAAQPQSARPPAPTPTVTPPAVTPSVPATAIPPGATLYHFVILSTDNKHRALKRYNQLLGYQLNIKMDQKDSSWFKLYFPIAALTRDTTSIKDSLSDTYAAPKVFIEH